MNEMPDEQPLPRCPYCLCEVGIYCTKWLDGRTIRQQFLVCRCCGWKPTPGQRITRYALPVPPR